MCPSSHSIRKVAVRFLIIATGGSVFAPTTALGGQLSMRFAGGGNEITLAQNQTAVVEIVWDGGPLDGGKTPRRVTGVDLRFFVVRDANAEAAPNPSYGNQSPPEWPASSDFNVENVGSPIAGWSNGATIMGPYNYAGFYLSAGDPNGLVGPIGDTPPTQVASFVIRKTTATLGDTYASIAVNIALPFVFNGGQFWSFVWQYDINGPGQYTLGQGNPGDGAPVWNPTHCLEIFQPLIIHASPFTPGADCNFNDIRDEFEIPCLDCNANGLLDECETAANPALDCNFNQAPDACDVSSGESLDCNANGRPDECDLDAAHVASLWETAAGSWGGEANWCPQGVPNNDTNRVFDVEIEGPGSTVTLDVSPSIDTLAIRDGATLEVNGGSGSAVRSIAVADPIQNEGRIRAADGRRLLLDASDIDQNSNGVIEAVGNPGEASKVQILGRRVQGGTVRTQGDSAKVELLGGAVLEDVIVDGNVGRDGGGTRQLRSTVVVPNQQSGIISGTIVNVGQIEVNAVSYTTSLKPGPAGAVLTGAGRVSLLSPPAAPLAELGGALLTLANGPDHLIHGSGVLVGEIDNDGVVTADAPGQRLVINESGAKTLGPSGIYRAQDGGILEIQKRINHPPFDPSEGHLEAVDAGIVRLRHPKGDAIVVRCSSAAASANGILELADSSRLEIAGPAGLILDSGGRWRAAGPLCSASLFVSGSVRVSGTGTALELTDSMTAAIQGNLSVTGGAHLTVGPEAAVRLEGGLENQLTSPFTFNWDDGRLLLDGNAPQQIEVAGRELGPSPAGLETNFALGTLELASGAEVTLVDSFDNQQDGNGPCDEALYVRTLVLALDSRIYLDNVRLYYQTLEDHGGAVEMLGCGALVEVAAGIAPQVLGAFARKPNPAGAAGLCDLPLDPAPGAPIATEMRQGGITELVFFYDATPVSLSVAVESDCACPSPPNYQPIVPATTCVPSAASMVCSFSPPLANGCTYRFTVPSGEGTAQFELRALVGDVNSDGFVNGGDRSAVIGVWTSPASFSCATDLNLTGTTNGNDRSIVIGAWTGSGTNCAP